MFAPTHHRRQFIGPVSMLQTPLIGLRLSLGGILLILGFVTLRFRDLTPDPMPAGMQSTPVAKALA